ncbi:MAG: hypothetical protein ACE14P_05440 [Methanotrichaceae archaeon]
MEEDCGGYTVEAFLNLNAFIWKADAKGKVVVLSIALMLEVDQ